MDIFAEHEFAPIEPNKLFQLGGELAQGCSLDIYNPVPLQDKPASRTFTLASRYLFYTSA